MKSALAVSCQQGKLLTRLSPVAVLGAYPEPTVQKVVKYKTGVNTNSTARKRSEQRFVKPGRKFFSRRTELWSCSGRTVRELQLPKYLPMTKASSWMPSAAGKPVVYNVFIVTLNARIVSTNFSRWTHYLRNTSSCITHRLPYRICSAAPDSYTS